MAEAQSEDERKRQLQAEYEETRDEYQKGNEFLIALSDKISVPFSVIDRMERAGFFWRLGNATFNPFTTHKPTHVTLINPFTAIFHMPITWIIKLAYHRIKRLINRLTLGRKNADVLKLAQNL